MAPGTLPVSSAPNLTLPTTKANALGTWVRAAVVAILGAVILTSPVWLGSARPFVAPLQAGLGGPDPPPPTEAPPARPNPTPTPTPSPPAVSPTPEPQTESPASPGDNTQTTPQEATPERPSAAELARRAAARAAARERARRAAAAAALRGREREARTNRERREAAFLAVANRIERSDAVTDAVAVAAKAADPDASPASSEVGGNGWGRIGVLLFLVLSAASALAAVLPYVTAAHRATATAGANARSHRMDAVIGLTRSHRAELVALSVGALLLGLLLLGMS